MNTEAIAKIYARRILDAQRFAKEHNTISDYTLSNVPDSIKDLVKRYLPA